MLHRLSFRKVIYYLLSLIVGALFLFSAYTKIETQQALEAFDISIADTGLFSFKVANALARIIISVEIFLGICFLLDLSESKRVYQLAAALLLLFQVYLLWILFTYGDGGNCGCFGEKIRMTPLQAYLKNLVLLAIIYALHKLQDNRPYQKSSLGAILLIIAVITGVCCYSRPDFIYLDAPPLKNKYSINLDPLYADSIPSKIPFDYKKGKHIISVLSLSCTHCKNAARRMHILLKNNPKLPFYNLYGGDSVRLKAFFKETKAENVPYQLCKNVDLLYELSKNGVPSILWVEDGYVVREINHHELELNKINKWINKK